MIHTNTPIHTQTNIEPERNGMIFARKFPAAAGFRKCVENIIKFTKKYKEQMKRRYIVTDLLRLIYFFIYELVIIPIFCKTKFSECSARERETLANRWE